MAPTELCLSKTMNRGDEISCNYLVMGTQKLMFSTHYLILLEVRSCTKIHMTLGTLAPSLLPTYRHDVDGCSAIKEGI